MLFVLCEIILGYLNPVTSMFIGRKCDNIKMFFIIL